nr:MAG TPA: hypothetical protein [Caudoviricetes sp.]
MRRDFWMLKCGLSGPPSFQNSSSSPVNRFLAIR